MSIKIISWNVNGIRATTKKGGFDWLLSADADMFCLQETKAHPEQLEPGIVTPEGYTSYFDNSKGRKGYSGVAIYIKNKHKAAIEKVEYGFGKPDYDQEGRMITVFMKDFALSNVYFPNGGGGPERLAYKMAFYDHFLEYIEKIKASGLPVIFCGDVNTAHEAIDLARPKENEKNTGFLPEERAWLDEVVAHGYVDMFRKFYPSKEGAYTYWDMKTFARERNVGWRIDYFFASADIVPRIQSTKIHSEIIGSDHCPIEILLK